MDKGLFFYNCPIENFHEIFSILLLTCRSFIKLPHRENVSRYVGRRYSWYLLYLY
jgi:hypothetical protein